MPEQGEGQPLSGQEVELSSDILQDKAIEVKDLLEEAIGFSLSLKEWGRTGQPDPSVLDASTSWQRHFSNEQGKQGAMLYYPGHYSKKILGNDGKPVETREIEYQVRKGAPMITIR